MATTTNTPKPLEMTSAGVVRSVSKPQLDALTGIRAIAAFLVVFAHFEMIWHMATLDNADSAFARWCARGDWQLLGIAVPGYERSDSLLHFLMRGIVFGAYVAVDIFFMLSGFILTYTCMSDDGSLRINRGGFWATRFSRIYPVYLVGMFVSSLVFIVTTSLREPPMSSGERWAMVLATLGLVQAWWPQAANALNPPAWSLSAEAFFYIVFPFLLLFVDRLSRPGLWRLLVFAYVAALVPPAIYVAIAPDPGYDMSWLGEGTWLQVIKYNPLIRFPEFLAGVVLGKLFAHRAMHTARQGNSTTGWLSVLALLGMFAGMCVTEYVPYPIMHNGMLVPFVGLFIYDLSMGGGPVGRFFGSRPMVLLGNSTYCIYILHASFIGYTMMVVWFLLGGEQTLKYEAAKVAYEQAQARGDTSAAAPTPPDLSSISPDSIAGPIPVLIGVGLACLVASILMHKLYEEPCRRYLRRKLSRRAHLTIPPPSKAAELP